MKEPIDQIKTGNNVLRIAQIAAGLIALLYIFGLLLALIQNFSLYFEFDNRAHGTIASIIGGATVPLALAIPAWVAVLVSILCVIFVILWFYFGWSNKWLNSWLARWRALGNCATLPTWWQRLHCRLETLKLIEEFLVVCAGATLMSMIAALNAAIVLG